MRDIEKGLKPGRNLYLLLLAAIFLISGLSFFLGYLMKSDGGHQDLPARPGVAASKKEGSRETVPLSVGVASLENKADLVKESELTFFKSLSEVPSKTSKRVSVKEPAGPEQKSVYSEKGRSETKKRKQVKRELQTEPAATEIRKMFTIQVASFKEKHDAFTLKDSLEKKGYDSYIMIFSKDDTKWFRVRVGAVKTREAARALLEKLKTSEKPGGYIARYTR